MYWMNGRVLWFQGASGVKQPGLGLFNFDFMFFRFVSF